MGIPSKYAWHTGLPRMSCPNRLKLSSLPWKTSKSPMDTDWGRSMSVTPCIPGTLEFAKSTYKMFSSTILRTVPFKYQDA